MMSTFARRYRYARIEMARLWIIEAAGYSSKSTIFLLMFSMINLSASSGIHVCTNLRSKVDYEVVP